MCVRERERESVCGCGWVGGRTTSGSMASGSTFLRPVDELLATSKVNWATTLDSVLQEEEARNLRPVEEERRVGMLVRRKANATGPPRWLGKGAVGR